MTTKPNHVSQSNAANDQFAVLLETAAKRAARQAQTQEDAEQLDYLARWEQDEAVKKLRRAAKHRAATGWELVQIGVIFAVAIVAAVTCRVWIPWALDASAWLIHTLGLAGG